MDLQLAGKRALVTGSSAGIGESIAKVLAAEGAAVVVHGRNEKRAHRVAEEIIRSGGKAVVAIGDLATDVGAKRVGDKALAALGGVEILVNNAGVYKARGWMEVTPEQWAESYNDNIVSMVRMVHLLLPQMKKLGWGRILQISSGVATNPPGLLPDYSATKAATTNLTVSLSKELAGTGITVNTVSPGPILTARFRELWLQAGLVRGWGKNWDEIEQYLLKKIMPSPAGRLGRVEDVAHMVAFLSSPLAGFVNGANLRVDGGRVPTIN